MSLLNRILLMQLLVLSNIAMGDSFYSSLQDHMKRFQTDTASYMQSVPTKEGGPSIRTHAMGIFSSALQEGFFDYRGEIRSQILCDAGSLSDCKYRLVPQVLSPIGRNETPYWLVDAPETLMEYLGELDREPLFEARLKKETQPWSDTYWPYYAGLTGQRYADPNNVRARDFLMNMQRMTTPESKLSMKWDSAVSAPSDWDILSPSEKLDVFLGYDQVSEAERSRIKNILNFGMYELPDGLLTPNQWFEGLRYYHSSKTVETWMGLCHGWAAASYVVPRPIYPVDVPVVGRPERKIRFYPADIKALATLIWSAQPTKKRYAGSRCYTKNPERDPKTGRVLDPDCNDTNPATFHLSTIHQIGKRARSFIMDATYDYEVWNQPVIGYKFVYFDPADSSKTSYSWSEVARDKDDVAWQAADKFRTFRVNEGDSSYYQKVVGVFMEVEYLVETHPRQMLEDTYQLDATRKVSYMYDLEVTSEGRAVGGEWYSNTHPDFLWAVPEGLYERNEHLSDAGRQIQSEWKMGEPLPLDWIVVARNRALYDRVPLDRIVDSLVKFSQSKPESAERR